MKRNVEIRTGAYEEPYRTMAIWNDGEDILSITWKQRHEGENSDTRYEMKMDKKTGICALKRTGAIKSTMLFDTARETTGIFDTPYGRMEMRIRTEFINLPSVLSPRFEISYELPDNSGMNRNRFAVCIV
ncbi:MAG TPA: hypothetical protein DCW41_03990 [Clostridiales bacterium]|nr:hypothetical protein [Clostridiales bacterium]